MMASSMPARLSLATRSCLFLVQNDFNLYGCQHFHGFIAQQARCFKSPWSFAPGTTRAAHA